MISKYKNVLCVKLSSSFSWKDVLLLLFDCFRASFLILRLALRQMFHRLLEVHLRPS